MILILPIMHKVTRLSCLISSPGLFVHTQTSTQRDETQQINFSPIVEASISGILTKLSLVIGADVCEVASAFLKPSREINECAWLVRIPMPRLANGICRNEPFIGSFLLKINARTDVLCAFSPQFSVFRRFLVTCGTAENSFSYYFDGKVQRKKNLL